MPYLVEWLKSAKSKRTKKNKQKMRINNVVLLLLQYHVHLTTHLSWTLHYILLLFDALYYHNLFIFDEQRWFLVVKMIGRARCISPSLSLPLLSSDKRCYV